MILDDGWGANSSLENTRIDALLIRNSLQQAGFVVIDDSLFGRLFRELVGTRSYNIFSLIIYLIDIIWDSVRFTIEIPDRRLNDFKCSHTRVVQLAACFGKGASKGLL